MRKLFVYGTLKQHQPNFPIIKSGIFCGVGKLEKSSRYRMVSLGAFPALIPASITESQTITGEIWKVDENAFLNVELLEGYPTFYDREKLPVEDSEGNKIDIRDVPMNIELSSRQLRSVHMGTWLGKEDSLYGVVNG